MAKAPSKPAKTAKAAGPAAATSTTGGAAGTAPAEAVKINLYDGGALKSSLDDFAREVVLEAGYDENVAVSNVKIAVGSIAIGLALYAQFGPGKFPGNWWTIFTLVVMYMVLTAWLNIYSWRNEGEAFLLTKPLRGQSSGLRLSSKLNRFEHNYTLTMSSGSMQSPEEVHTSHSVTEFFHADGYLAEGAFRTAVEGLLEQYEAMVAGKGSKKQQ